MTPADRAAVQDLVHRYAALVDDRDIPAAVQLFAPDGVLVLPQPPEVLDPVVEHVGHAAIGEALAAVTALPLTFHEIVGVVLDDDPPRGRVACVAHHLLAPDSDLVWHLRYRDHYANTSAGWRITRRALHLDLIERRTVRRSRT